MFKTDRHALKKILQLILSAPLMLTLFLGKNVSDDNDGVLNRIKKAIFGGSK